MHKKALRSAQILLLIALVTSGSQTAQAKARSAGQQATPANISGSVSLLGQNWSRSYMKVVRSVSVPGTLLSLGGGLVAFIAWRNLRLRAITRRKKRD